MRTARAYVERGGPGHPHPTRRVSLERCRLDQVLSLAGRGRIQMFRKRTRSPWSCNFSGPAAGWSELLDDTER